MDIKVLPFGTMLGHMLSVRNMSAETLSKKTYIPRDAVGLLMRNLFDAKPELERRIRVALDWPEWLDAHIALVYSVKFSDTPDQMVHLPTSGSQPQVQAPLPPEKPVSPTQASPKATRLTKDGSPRKPWGSNRAKPRIEDDADHNTDLDEAEPLPTSGRAVA